MYLVFWCNVLRAEGFERGFPNGLPSHFGKRDASLHTNSSVILSVGSYAATAVLRRIIEPKNPRPVNISM